jgi:PPOX class probable FMN-dependent enzyme
MQLPKRLYLLAISFCFFGSPPKGGLGGGDETTTCATLFKSPFDMADEGEAGVYRNSGDAGATEVLDQEGDDDALMCPVVQGARGKAQWPLWRLALDKAIRSNKSQVSSKWFQLATVRVDGSPANRTVVFRGFVDGSDALYIVTDSRSNKVGEIARNPCAEIAWYFTISREQFRIRCKLCVVGPAYTAGETEKTSETSSPDLARLRVAAWQGMSCAARNGFAWQEI